MSDSACSLQSTAGQAYRGKIGRWRGNLSLPRPRISAMAARFEPMKVPYAKKWQKETDKLRKIAVDCGLTEELKWGKPCFTFQEKNVAIVIPLKESCAFSFFKGVLLKDPKHILERIGDHTQAARWIKFTSFREIAPLRSTLTDYVYEAIALEESGKKVELKKPSEYPTPEELQTRLDNNAGLRAGLRSAFPRSKEVIHFLRLKRQAGKNQISASRKVRADDPEWARIQRAA
jgi:uncharacterized protein YdeI (YjbR/CyaY-like superfamily)